MTARGFIQDKLEIKFLILYLAARVIEPVPFDTLLDLTLCDDAVDYFDFSECLADLVKTEHLTLDEESGLYAITEKGRQKSECLQPGSAAEESGEKLHGAAPQRNLHRFPVSG